MRPESLHDLLRQFPDIDGFWNYGDLTATEISIRSSMPESSPPTLANAEGTIHMARLLGFKGNLSDAKASLDEARKLLDAIPGDKVRADIRWDLEYGRWYVLSKFPSKATPMFMQALKKSLDANLLFFAVEAAIMISISQPKKAQKEWLENAIKIAESATEESAREWLSRLYVMRGWAEFDTRRFDDALKSFDQSLAVPRSKNDQNRVMIAAWSRGRVLRAIPRLEESLAIQRELHNELASFGGADGHVNLEIAECLQLLDKPDEAREFFLAAHKLLAADSYYADNHPHELSRMLRLSKQH